MCLDTRVTRAHTKWLYCTHAQANRIECAKFVPFSFYRMECDEIEITYCTLDLWITEENREGGGRNRMQTGIIKPTHNRNRMGMKAMGQNWRVEIVESTKNVAGNNMYFCIVAISGVYSGICSQSVGSQINDMEHSTVYATHDHYFVYIIDTEKFQNGLR